MLFLPPRAEESLANFEDILLVCVCVCVGCLGIFFGRGPLMMVWKFLSGGGLQFLKPHGGMSCLFFCS